MAYNPAAKQFGRVHMGCTAVLTTVSDWMCGSLVAQAARQYSLVLSTPRYFIELLLWVEDKRFAVHFGVDPAAVMRVTLFNLSGRGALQGASTISQQIYTIRVSSSVRFSRSLRYKLKQAGWALCASVAMSKAAILNEYLSTVYWGRSYHGLDKAARGYFNSTRTSLTIAQSFFLAERLAAPNRVSIQRISNLLGLDSIRQALSRNGAKLLDIVQLYQTIYGCGGEMWRLLEK